MTVRLGPLHLPMPHEPPKSVLSAHTPCCEPIHAAARVGAVLFGVESGKPGLFFQSSGRWTFNRGGTVTRERTAGEPWGVAIDGCGAVRPYATLQDAWLGLFDVAAALHPEESNAFAACKAREAKRLAQTASLARRSDVIQLEHPWCPLPVVWQNLGKIGPLALRRSLFSTARYGRVHSWAGQDGDYGAVYLLHRGDRRALGWLGRTPSDRWRLTRHHKFAAETFGYAPTLDRALRRLITDALDRLEPAISGHQRLQCTRDIGAIVERIRRGELTLLDRPQATDIQPRGAQ